MTADHTQSDPKISFSIPFDRESLGDVFPSQADMLTERLNKERLPILRNGKEIGYAESVNYNEESQRVELTCRIKPEIADLLAKGPIEVSCYGQRFNV